MKTTMQVRKLRNLCSTSATLVLLTLLLLPVAIAAGEFGAGLFGEGLFGFGTPEPAVQPQSSGGGGGSSSGGGGGGRLFDGARDRFENGSRSETFAYGDVLQFYIDDKRYNLMMIKLNTNSVKLRITPGTIDFDVRTTAEVDVNNDNKKDIKIELDKVLNTYSAALIFTIIEDEIVKKIIPKPKEEVIIEEEPDDIAEPVDISEREAIVEPKPQKAPIAWIIAIITIILGIVLMLVYQKNKSKEEND